MILAFLALLLIGGLGVILRFSLQHLLNNSDYSLPYGTICANLLGCFLIGVASHVFRDSDNLLKLAIMTGFLGGLTTLSSFALELLNLLRMNSFIYASIYWLIGSIASVALVFIGVEIAKLLS